MKLYRPYLEKKGEFKLNNTPLILIVMDSRGKTLTDCNQEAINNGKVMAEFHYFIDRNGKIFSVRPENADTEIASDTINNNTIVVCLEGDFINHDLEGVQGNSLMEVCIYLKEKYPYINEIQAYYEIFKNSDNPGPSFPINYINSLFLNNNRTYVKVKDHTVSSFMDSENEIYTYKHRDLFLTFPRIHGNDVKILSIKLLDVGSSLNAITSIFTEEMAIAVNDVRKVIGMPLNGRATIDFMNELDFLLNKKYNIRKNTNQFTRVLEVRTPYMEGNDVERVQNILKFLKLYDGKINSKYTQATSESVIEFQKSRSLQTIDGKVGPITWNELNKVKFNQFNRLIYLTEPPMSGEDIRNIQRELSMLGYDVEVNGFYDKQTETAVIKFQRDNALKADGIINLATFNAIYDINN